MTPGTQHWRESPTAWRTTPRPVGWKATCQRIKTRDGHRCTWVEQGQRCTTTTQLEVDHIGDNDDHSDDNLRTLCTPHHAKRTGAQAAAARWAKTRARQQRPQRPHPGLTE